jgi:hypothetical protein
MGVLDDIALIRGHAASLPMMCWTPLAFAARTPTRSASTLGKRSRQTLTILNIQLIPHNARARRSAATSGERGVKWGASAQLACDGARR